jgi:polyvinyl alcohol dehydrogenase (cytochrome)
MDAMLCRMLVIALLAGWAFAADSGEAVYAKRCASCHSTVAARVPTKEALQSLSASRIIRTLDFGTMLSIGSRLTREEREAVAAYLGKPGGDTQPPATAFCKDRSVNLSNQPQVWNGWSPTSTNARFQKSAGLGLEQVRKLKLKWAFGLEGDIIAFAPPSIIGGHIFVGSASGRVHALDANTGCIRWSFQADGPVRAAITAAPLGNKFTLLFGDQTGWFYSLEAETGKLRWKKKPETHEATRLTAAAVVHDGVVYVPASSWEENRALNADYPCCTFRGSLTALRVRDGAQLWKTFMIPDAAKPVEISHTGRPELGPSGAAIWAAPTLDLKRGLIYVTTGDNYTEPATAMSDAVVAVELKSGKIVWAKQAQPNDIFNGACGANCPGPDFDYGSSVILEKTESGRELMLVGQKSGIVYALDPDKKGEIVWQLRVGKGGTNGGVQWGMASDGQRVYAATSDVVRARGPGGDPLDPRPRPLDPTQGGGLTGIRIATGEKVWFAPPVVCKPIPGCSPAQAAAVTAIPGAVFSGAIDGTLRAYSAEDGKVLWDFDTVREFETVNGVKAKGGSMDGPGPVVANGMVFVNSGYARVGAIGGNVLLAFSAE